MDFDTLQQAIKKYINALLQDDEDIFLVEVKVNPGNDIKVFLDADNGITIEKCIRVNRALYKQIEQESLFQNGDFALEVSSPGVDEPLKLQRQYQKNIGRKVEVLLNDETRKQGKLISVNNDGISIEETEGKGKKALTKKITILFNQIRHTKVLVTF